MSTRATFAAWSVAAGLAIAAAGPAQARDTLTIGVAQFPPSLHPGIDAVVVKTYVDDFVSRPMTAYDADWRLQCMLCTTLPTIENGGAKFEDLPGGKQGIAVTFTLKPGLAWGDGAPVTSKDIVFTWKVGKDPKSGFAIPLPWERASSIDVVDDRTVVIHLPKIDISYNQWDKLLPEHLEGPIYDKAANPGDYGKATLYATQPTNPGLYDGPYVVSDYQASAQIVLTANPHWPGKKPGLARIVLRDIENTAALQANLESGDVDMTPGEGIGLQIDQVLAMQKKEPDKFVYLYKPSLNYEHIDLQIGNPMLKDIRVRRALLYAIDRKTLTGKLFDGKQPVAATWVNPLDSNYTKDTAVYPYDPAKARALLKEAGYTPGADGICRNAKGERLAFEIGTTAGNKLRELTEQVLISQWKSACISVSVKNEPARSFFGVTVRQRLYTAMAMYAWSSNVGESPRHTLHSSQIPTEANSFGGANYIAFSDPKMDADIEAMESELDPAKRRAYWVDMQKIYADQVRVLPLFFRAEPYALPKWLKGFQATGHGDYSPLWAENWRAE
jgi:peptide/nickel transport system substrate-binding protein